VLRQDGARRIVETHGRSPEGPAGVRLTAIRDVTARKEAEAALRESETRFRQLAEVTPEGIAITEDTRLVDGNPQLAALLGYDLPEILGRPIWDFIPAQAHEIVARHLEHHAQSTYESYVLNKQGKEIPVEVCAQTMLWQGKPRRVTILRDLTATRKAAEDLEASRTALERSRRMAELNEVGAAIVHQLGQPFSAITGNVSAIRHLLNQGNGHPAELDEAFREIESDLQNVREIMARLRAWTHPEHLKRDPVDPNALVEEVLRVLHPQAEQQRISVRSSCEPPLPAVYVDRVQMIQAILNVVQNALDAVHACPADRRLVEITTTSARGGTGVEITVRDHGTGLPPGAEERIFDPFFTTKADGMGVGLRISQTIIRAHRGTIEGRNNPDWGATFRIRLPACAPAFP
jgi:PAS domain S-box-containing protein